MIKKRKNILTLSFLILIALVLVFLVTFNQSENKIDYKGNYKIQENKIDYKGNYKIQENKIQENKIDYNSIYKIQE